MGEDQLDWFDSRENIVDMKVVEVEGIDRMMAKDMKGLVDIGRCKWVVDWCKIVVVMVTLDNRMKRYPTVGMVVVDNKMDQSDNRMQAIVGRYIDVVVVQAATDKCFMGTAED